MNKVVKTVLIIVTVIVSFYLLCIFILYNFPYNTLVNRIDTELRKRYGISFGTGEVRYGYPFRIILRDIEITQRKEHFTIAADDVTIRMRLLNFRKYKTIEIHGAGIAVRNNFIDASGGFVQLNSSVNLKGLVRSRAVDNVQTILLRAGGMDIKRVTFSGFEFSDLKLQQVLVELEAGENEFSVRRGLLKADVVQSELTGKLDERGPDVIVSVSLTGAFYDRFGDLKGLVDSFFKNGKLRIQIQGGWKSPRVKIIK